MALAFICFYVAIRKMIHPAGKETKIFPNKHKKGHK